MTDEIMDVERENHQAIVDRENYEENFMRGQDEDEPEPSEEDLALVGMDKEHVMDFRSIKYAVARTDLSERVINLAVLAGLKERK